VQSTAALVLSARGEIDFPVPLFANVGDDSEKKATLRYVRTVAMPYARAHGVRYLELHRRRRDGTRETLLGKMHRLKTALPIPVRMPDTGAPGTRSCTADLRSRWSHAGSASTAPPARTLRWPGWGSAWMRSTAPAPTQASPIRCWSIRCLRWGCAAATASGSSPRPAAAAPQERVLVFPLRRPSEWARMQREDPREFAAACALEAMLIQRRRTLGKDRCF
jgi:hypothetical protein